MGGLVEGGQIWGEGCSNCCCALPHHGIEAPAARMKLFGHQLTMQCVRVPSQTRSAVATLVIEVHHSSWIMFSWAEVDKRVSSRRLAAARVGPACPAATQTAIIRTRHSFSSGFSLSRTALLLLMRPCTSLLPQPIALCERGDDGTPSMWT